MARPDFVKNNEEKKNSGKFLSSDNKRWADVAESTSCLHKEGHREVRVYAQRERRSKLIQMKNI